MTRNYFCIFGKLAKRKYMSDESLNDSWFYPRMSRKDAEKYLKETPAGTFIVRKSYSHPTSYVLSVSMPIYYKFHNSGVCHYLVHKTKVGFKFKGFAKEWPNLESVLTHLAILPEFLPCPLRLFNEPKPPDQSDDTYVYFAEMEEDEIKLNNTRNEELLKSNGPKWGPTWSRDNPIFLPDETACENMKLHSPNGKALSEHSEPISDIAFEKRTLHSTPEKSFASDVVAFPDLDGSQDDEKTRKWLSDSSIAI